MSTADNPLACHGDKDCPGTQVCLGSPSWASESIWHTCQCSPYYGWDGLPACEDLGHAAFIMAVVYLIMAFVALVTVSVGSCILLWLVARKKMRIPANSVIGTYVLSWFALVFCVCWFTTSATIILTPARYTKLREDANEGLTKYHQLSDVETSFILMALVTGTASILNICLVWMRVVRGTNSLASSTARYMNYSRRVVYFAEVLYVLILVPCFALRVIELGIFITLPFYVFIAISYVYAQEKLIMLLQRAALFDSTPQHQKLWYQKQIYRVRLTAISIVALLFFTVLFGCLYSGFYLSPGGWMEHAGTSGTLGVLQIVYIFVPISNVSLVIAVMAYSCLSLIAIHIRARARTTSQATHDETTNAHTYDSRQPPHARDLEHGPANNNRNRFHSNDDSDSDSDSDSKDSLGTVSDSGTTSLNTELVSLGSTATKASIKTNKNIKPTSNDDRQQIVSSPTETTALNSV